MNRVMRNYGRLKTRVDVQDRFPIEVVRRAGQHGAPVPSSPLSGRQLAVLRALAAGSTFMAIGNQLGLTPPAKAARAEADQACVALEVATVADAIAKLGLGPAESAGLPDGSTIRAVS